MPASCANGAAQQPLTQWPRRLDTLDELVVQGTEFRKRHDAQLSALREICDKLQSQEQVDMYVLRDQVTRHRVELTDHADRLAASAEAHASAVLVVEATSTAVGVLQVKVRAVMRWLSCQESCSGLR